MAFISGLPYSDPRAMEFAYLFVLKDLAQYVILHSTRRKSLSVVRRTVPFVAPHKMIGHKNF